jgi:eukaryotic-like serine/threonine-protein kinase
MSGDAVLPVQVGGVLAGKYRIERVLGSGAMGVVAAVTHTELGELRAIKFMRDSLVHDAAAVERFLREARATARLQSRHVAKVHDVGRLESGAPYIVMECFEGTDLKSILAERGALPVPEAVRYVREACEAIAEAHAAGIIHRDLKPSNLFVAATRDASCVKVLDFGVAKLAVEAAADPATEMTGTADILGTPLYMSPEQMRSTRNVDPRADIWSLGVILYRALTGHGPFAGQNATEVCISVMVDQPTPPSTHRPDLPPRLDAIIMRCLEKDPARRFETATALAEALLPFESFETFETSGAPGETHSLESTSANAKSVSKDAALAPIEPPTLGTGTSWAQARPGAGARTSRGRVIAFGALAAAVVVAAIIGARFIAEPGEDAATSIDGPSPQPQPAVVPPAETAAPEVSPAGPAIPSPTAAPVASALPSARGVASVSTGGAVIPVFSAASHSSGVPSASAAPTVERGKPAGRPSSTKEPIDDAFGTSRK